MSEPSSQPDPTDERVREPQVWCSNPEPHEAHWHTIREGGITFAGGRCLGKGKFQSDPADQRTQRYANPALSAPYESCPDRGGTGMVLDPEASARMSEPDAELADLRAENERLRIARPIRRGPALVTLSEMEARAAMAEARADEAEAAVGRVQAALARPWVNQQGNALRAAIRAALDGADHE